MWPRAAVRPARTALLAAAAEVSRNVHLGSCGRRGAAVELTAVRYPAIKRGSFSPLTDRHVQHFEGVLGKERVLTDPADVAPFNVDWIKMVRGQSKVVLKPRTTEEVSAILKYCNSETLAVCPQGGNTGLVGGSVPVFDEIVISTARMNDIISMDELSGALVCQSGCVLEQLQSFASERGFIVPLDLGAKGSCHIGGNVSTNAGGIRLLRYGSLHSSVLGIEAVKADGEVIDCLSSLKKDNTGFHLKHLFIGSEGTLGFLTKVAIQCPPAPKSVNLAFLGLESFEAVLKVSQRAKRQLGEVLSACEVIDRVAMESVTSLLGLRSPIAECPFSMVIETSGSRAEHDEEKLNAFLQAVTDEGDVLDGTVVTEPSKVRLRERIAEALTHDGYLFIYDVTLPLQDFYALIPELTKRVANHPLVNRCCGYGHLGDGNLHFHVTSKAYDESLHALIEPFVFEWVSARGGSVSSEHGLGLTKTLYLHMAKSASAISLMQQLKTRMDPKGILNPYKVLPTTA